MKRLGKLLLLLVTAALLVTGYRVWRDWGLPEELIELRERYPERPILWRITGKNTMWSM